MHCAAQIIATTLTAQNGLVNLPAGKIIVFSHFGAQKTLVVTEVEVSLGTIFGDINFTVLVGAHGARIDIQVGIEFEDSDIESAGFEDRAKRRC